MRPSALAPLSLLRDAGHSFSQTYARLNIDLFLPTSSSPLLFTLPPHYGRARSLGSDVVLSVSALISP